MNHLAKESANTDSNSSEKREAKRKLVPRAIDNVDVLMDKVLDNLRTQEEPGRCLAGGQDVLGVCEDTQLLLKRSPEKTVQRRSDTEDQDSQHCQQESGEDDGARQGPPPGKKHPESYQIRLKWPPEGSTLKPVPERSGTDSKDADNAEEEPQKRMFGKRRKRSTAEIRQDPEFARFLLKWPPDGSTFARSAAQSFADRQK